MKTRILLIALFLIPIVSTFAENGWQNAKWGMSVAEVQQLFPTAKTVSPPSQYEQKGAKYQCHLRLLGYELIGRDFFVDFLFDSDAKLAGTIVGTPIEEGSMEMKYKNLKELLAQKYGQPTGIESRDGGDTVVWLKEQTEIRLNYLVISAVGYSGIRLIYLKQQTDALDKL